MISPGMQEWIALVVVSLVAAAILMPVVRGVAAAYAQRLLRQGRVKDAMRWRSFAQKLSGGSKPHH